MPKQGKTKEEMICMAREYTLKEYGKGDLQARNLGIIYLFLLEVFDA